MASKKFSEEKFHSGRRKSLMLGARQRRNLSPGKAAHTVLRTHNTFQESGGQGGHGWEGPHHDMDCLTKRASCLIAKKFLLLCSWVCAHVLWCPWRSVALTIPRAGGTGSCELPNIDAENQTWVLCKRGVSSSALLTTVTYLHAIKDPRWSPNVPP